MLSRPPFYIFLPSGPPRKHVSRARTHAFAGWGRVWSPNRPAKAWHTRPQGRRPRPFLAVVEFDLAVQRQSTPMRVKRTDPCRAPWPPYRLGRRGRKTAAQIGMRLPQMTQENDAATVFPVLPLDKTVLFPRLLTPLLGRVRYELCAPGGANSLLDVVDRQFEVFRRRIQLPAQPVDAPSQPIELEYQPQLPRVLRQQRGRPRNIAVLFQEYDRRPALPEKRPTAATSARPRRRGRPG